MVRDRTAAHEKLLANAARNNIAVPAAASDAKRRATKLELEAGQIRR